MRFYALGLIVVLASPFAVTQDLIGLNFAGDAFGLSSETGTGSFLGVTGFTSHNALGGGAGPLYSIGAGGTLLTVDRETGVATSIALTITEIRGLAVSPTTGTLYAIVNGAPDDFLYTINVVTGAGTLIGATTGFDGLQALAFDATGTLYGWDINEGLVTISTLSGAVTDVSIATGATVSIQCLAVSNDGVLYGARDSLYTLNTASGAATLVGSGGYNDLRGMEFGYVAEPVDFRKVMISEVSSGNPDYVEIINCGLSSANLAGWTLLWKDGPTQTSAPLNITLAAGEIAIIGETGATLALTPCPGVQFVERLGTIGTASGDYAVALVDNFANVVDEVRVTSTVGVYGEGSLGGTFRGVALRNFPNGSVERCGCIDTNSGSDWTDQASGSAGCENHNSGPRGTDTVPSYEILINETDDSPDYIELFNPNLFAVDLSDWTLWTDANQGGAHTIVTPFAGGFVLGAGQYVVIGDGAIPPVEMPGGVTYIDVTQNIPWNTNEYDCALYDRHGRLVDLMRTTGDDDIVVHNLPRAPSCWNDFRGSAGRATSSGDAAIGRVSSTDTDMGSDFQPVFTRTMGTGNSGFASFNDGTGTVLDVRVNDSPLHGGFVILANAGSANAGGSFGFFVSLSHSFGVGPFFGLGADAFAFGLFPCGILDADGFCGIETLIPPGTLPPNSLDADIIGILLSPTGFIVDITQVLEYDAT